MMDKNKHVYRFYKISINFGIYYYYNNTRVYKLKKGLLPYFVGFLYSILNILLGFWGIGIIIGLKGIRKSFEAIHYNITGGIDMGDIEEAQDYDDKTNYIFNNLLRSTSEKISREEVEIISDIFDSFIEIKGGDYKDNVEQYILKCLTQIDINWIQKDEIRDVLETIVQYKNYCAEDFHFA